MADLPRFTQGNFGNLQWHHLNQVFDVIERSPVPMERKRDPQESSFVYAKLTGEAATAPGGKKYSWVEIELDWLTNESSERDGGRRSGTATDPFQVPALGISGSEAYQIGDVVLLRLESFPNGKRFALVIKPTGSDVKMFRIIGAASIAAARWRYTGIIAGLDTDSWVDRGTQQYTLYNGCENAVDFGNTIGVGTVKPGSAQAVRRPIRDDTIVQAVYIDGAWCFSIPNGYSFACA